MHWQLSNIVLFARQSVSIDQMTPQRLGPREHAATFDTTIYKLLDVNGLVGEHLGAQVELPGAVGALWNKKKENV